MIIAALTVPAGAINLNLTPADIETALDVGRGTAAQRARFHAAYIVPVTSPFIERLEVITETRRLVRITEERIRVGDNMFSHSTRAVREALTPWQGRLSVLAQLRFNPQNNYLGAPQVTIALGDAPTPVVATDTTTEPILGFPMVAPAQRQPVLGALSEALFDAATVGQTTRSITVSVDGAVVAQASIDFSRLP